MSGINDVGGRSVTDEEDNEGVVATMADMLARVCDVYVGSATLTDLPVLANEMICFRLSNPSDRFSLRATSRSLLPTVDGSWRDLQTLEIRFADSPLMKMESAEGGKDTACGGGRLVSDVSPLMVLPDYRDPRITRVNGTMKDPDTGEQREFKQTVRSSKLMEFLKWIGPRLPSLKLKTNDRWYAWEKDYPLISAADGHPISVVLSACADATVMPSVVDVCVQSRRLLCDCSLFDSLIRWAEYRRHAADNDATPFWRSLTLEPGASIYLGNQLFDHRREILLRLRKANGEPPADIRLLLDLDHGVGEVMFDVDGDDPTQVDSPSSRWRQGLKEIQVEKLRRWGSRDPEGDGKLALSLLQKLMDRCESLLTLRIDEVLHFLELRPTVLHYPKTLTKLKCDRLGKVPGEIAVIVKNCPLLEYISADCSAIDRGDIVALTKLNRLKVLKLQFIWMPIGYFRPELSRANHTEFTLAVFGVDSVDQLHQIGSESSPWPMLEEIRVMSHLVPHHFIAVLINCCPKLTRFDIASEDGYEERATTGLMLDQLCRLTRLSQLRWIGPIWPSFGDLHVDSLTTCCPNLQDLYIYDTEMDLMSLPRLLRGCPELRTVDLRSFYIELTAPDGAAMLFDIAADVGDRERRVVIKVLFVDVSRESFDQIDFELPPDVCLCLSAFSNLCLHRRRRCWRCCFEDDRSACHSFVIGHIRRPHAAVVFKYDEY